MTINLKQLTSHPSAKRKAKLSKGRGMEMHRQRQWQRQLAYKTNFLFMANEMKIWNDHKNEWQTHTYIYGYSRWWGRGLYNNLHRKWQQANNMRQCEVASSLANSLLPPARSLAISLLCYLAVCLSVCLPVWCGMWQEECSINGSNINQSEANNKLVKLQPKREISC